MCMNIYENYVFFALCPGSIRILCKFSLIFVVYSNTMQKSGPNVEISVYEDYISSLLLFLDFGLIPVRRFRAVKALAQPSTMARQVLWLVIPSKEVKIQDGPIPAEMMG